MSKKSSKRNLQYCAVALAATMLCAGAAQAGPRIEFGDDGGFVQIDLKGQFYLENTSLGGGNDGKENRTDLHFMRNRLGLTGMLDETWGYKFQTCGNTGTTKNPFMYTLSQQDTDWNDRDIRIIDAYAIANFNEHINLKVGLTKIPLSRANLDDCFAPLSQDRSMFVYSAYGSSPAKFSRDLGGVAVGRFFNDRLTYFAGIFQGREGTSQTAIPYAPNYPNGAPNKIMGAPATTSTAPKTNLEYVARLTFDFLESEGGSGYQGTYFGEKKILNIGVGGAFQPQAAYKNTQNVYWLSDGTSSTTAPGPATTSSVTKVTTMANTSKGTVDYSAIAVDGMFEYPTAFGVPTITAQYLKVDFEDAYLTASSGDKLAVVSGMNGQKEGFYTKVAHILPFKIGGMGKLQPYALYENWRFAHLLGVDGQRIEQIGGGLNYYITGDQRVRLTAEYLKTDFSKKMAFVVPGASTPGVASGYVKDVNSFDTFRMMLQVVF
ncbi:selenite/tellurite reduction operon porin ExtI [Trichlorobacter lovleyi]|uniref:Outer membrane porin FmdC, putative n=1 Tax=Trichlorobacter lovleyi (strain ATCC BAA-1151 / DSM 17278 / SZ) TaxID=398767 RepID=B3E6S2_TRIL1|nr:selenite/tellurite reduction operon porin ExtI [Trichlorobacter lovleyi]ACD94897.1 outer membrane porin FmdC, putative [Trichlorobacter lovleyi SZ]